MTTTPEPKPAFDIDQFNNLLANYRSQGQPQPTQPTITIPASADSAPELKSMDPGWRAQASIIFNGDGKAPTLSLNGGDTLEAAMNAGAPVEPVDWRDTCISPTGAPIHESMLTPDSLVTINGIQARADSWQAQGVLRKTADGYVEAPPRPPSQLLAQAQAQRQAAVQQASSPTPSDFTEAQIHQLNGFQNSVGTGNLALLINNLVHSHDVPYETVLKLHSGALMNEGLTEGETVQVFNRAMALHSEVASKAAAKEGVTDIAALIDWARREQPQMYRRAMTMQYLGHDVSGVRELARTYAAAESRMDPKEFSKLDPKLKARVEGVQITVETKQGRTSLANARRLGLLDK